MDITKRLSHFLIKFLIISFVAGIFPGNLAWEVQIGVTAFAVPKMAYALTAVKPLWTFHQDLLPPVATTELKAIIDLCRPSLEMLTSR